MYNRLQAVRQKLREHNLDGLIIPHGDEHQCEYTPVRARRLSWLTGFTGSAGLAIMTRHQGAIYVDGRYYLQVKDQVDIKNFEPLKLYKDKPAAWFAAHLGKNARIAYDPALHTRGWIKELAQALGDITLVALSENIIDSLWQDRPPADKTPAFIQPLAYAGEEAKFKRERIAADLKADQVKAAVLTNLDSIAWLFNIRGHDVENTPVLLSYAILKNNGRADLFVDSDKINDAVRAHLGPDVTVRPYADFFKALKTLGRGGKRILIDPRTAAAGVSDRLEAGGAVLVEKNDPCLLPKACKNETELDGARAAHIRDGVALCRFLCWFYAHLPTGELDELSVADKLLSFRAEQDKFQGPSFDTISGAGPSGAIVHYKANPKSNRKITGNMLYLFDSGGQYLDGTTDVTRTLAIGQPTEEQKDRFTRVLKGHIALAQARFPVGRSGAHLDSLARKPLWDVGLDYQHGTGHGVGSFLSVHEGPQSISEKGFGVPLQPGMILSNEPGFYKAQEYGIRIENLVIVRPSHFDGEESTMNTLETITFVPIDTRLINLHMMTSAEITWLNIYHAQVREKIAPFLKGADLKWLEAATQSVMVV